MLDFVLNCFLWVCALYGLIEIIKTSIYTYSCKHINTDGINIIVAVKNKEDKIEGFLRALNFRILYGKTDTIENIMVLDLNSTDKTKQIVENFAFDYPCIKPINWNEFEELFSPK